MLQLREDQMASFAQMARNVYKRRVCEQLAEDGYLPDQVETDALDAFLERAIEVAAGYGIRIERDVYHFILILLRYGEDCIDRPGWIRDILADPALTTGSERAAVLYRTALARDAGPTATETRE